jgi:hypothetical protein
MSNPLDSFLTEYGQSKTAAKPSALAAFGLQGGNAIVAGIGGGVGAALAGSGALAVQHIYDAATSKRDFRGMLSWNKDLHDEDQVVVNQAFRTLRRFAPDLSRDPLVAGAMVRQMVQAPQGAAGIVQQAIQGQKNVGSPVLDAYMNAARAGASEGMRGMEPFGAKPGTMPVSEHERAMQNAFYTHHDEAGELQQQLAKTKQRYEKEQETSKATVRAATAYQKNPHFQRLVRRGILKPE